MPLTNDPTEPTWLAQHLRDTVFLFDFPAFLHRAMHACYGRRVRETLPTDGTCARQAIMMLANVVERLQCKRMMLIVDGIQDFVYANGDWEMSDAPLLRCDIYPAYKAARALQPDVFRFQAPILYRRLHELPLCVIRKERYEADDLIGTLVRMRGVPLCIVTSDKDMAQYIRDADTPIVLYDPVKKAGAFMGVAECLAKFGVGPVQIPDYIGLIGDPSDNIPGVPGIGPKAAAKLLANFHHLGDLYGPHRNQARALLNKKQFEALCEHEPQAFLSRRLAEPITTYSSLPMPVQCPPDTTDPLRAQPPHVLRQTARNWYG